MERIKYPSHPNCGDGIQINGRFGVLTSRPWDENVGKPDAFWTAKMLGETDHRRFTAAQMSDATIVCRREWTDERQALWGLAQFAHWPNLGHGIYDEGHFDPAPLVGQFVNRDAMIERIKELDRAEDERVDNFLRQAAESV